MIMVMISIITAKRIIIPIVIITITYNTIMKERKMKINSQKQHTAVNNIRYKRELKI